MDAPLIAQRLADLRQERKLSRLRLSWLTVREGFAGVPEGTIRYIETHPGAIPGKIIIEALAKALGVAPDSFYEYPIAKARAGEATVVCEEMEDEAMDEQEQDLEALAAQERAPAATGAGRKRGGGRAGPRR